MKGPAMNRKSLKRLLDRLLGAAKKTGGAKPVRSGLGEPQA
jgi:hypothetical protein